MPVKRSQKFLGVYPSPRMRTNSLQECHGGRRPDGTTAPVTFLKRVGPHPGTGIDTEEFLRALHGHEPTQAELAAGDSYAGSSAELKESYRKAKEEVLDG